MSKIIIDNINSTIEEKKIKISANITNLDSSISNIYFETLNIYANEINEFADPFLVATLFYAMRENASIYIDGTITYGLLRNLDRFQKAWCCWKPDVYHKIDITAKNVVEVAHNLHGYALQTFSGGLDSTFTTYQHIKKTAGNFSHILKTAIMIHGFDIPLVDAKIFQDIFERSKPILASIGVNLIPLKTNFRELWHTELKDWEDAFGSGMAACLMLLSKNHSYGLIASSEPYNSILLPWGSNPITDPFLSSSNFYIEHDGGEYTRGKKVSIVSNWQEGINNLRVCWQGNDIRYNCCKCEKCIRTILNFKSLGLPLPSSFPNDITEKDILSLRRLSEAHLNPLRQIVSEAKKNHIQENWISALEEVISINERDIHDGYIQPGQLPQILKD